MTDRDTKEKGGERKPGDERLLLRLVLDPDGERGELTTGQARELRERLDREPELAQRSERLRRTWDALEAPPEESLPPEAVRSLTARMAEEARSRRSPGLGDLLRLPGLAPAPVRAAAVVAFALGLLLGSWSFRSLDPRGLQVPALEVGIGVQTGVTEGGLEELWTGGEPALAELYLAALEAEDGAGAGEEHGVSGGVDGSVNGDVEGGPEGGVS